MIYNAETCQDLLSSHCEYANFDDNMYYDLITYGGYPDTIRAINCTPWVGEGRLDSPCKNTSDCDDEKARCIKIKS